MDKQTIPVFSPDPDQGLSGEQVLSRAEGGLAAGKPRPSGKTGSEIILSHTLTFFNLVFVILALLLVLGGSTVLNMGFLLVAIINTAIGIFQELRAKRAVEDLTLVARRPVTVIREGSALRIDPEELVRDDIAEFSQGDQLCADAILRRGELWVDESLLTGEADPVTKEPGDKLFSGSVVMAGRGRVQLTAVGEDAFAARLSREAKHNPKAKKSEMMRSLDKLIRVVGVILVPVGLILFYREYVVLGLGLEKSVEGTVAALVGMIPEGLYLLTSIALAASSVKLSRNRVLVQDMNCIETLARVDVLCVDKTGTITEPKMQVENLIPLSGHSHEELEAILTAMYGTREPDNATARAIAQLFSGTSRWKELRRIPFSPETRWMAVEFETAGTYLAGAPEAILGSRFPEYRDQVTAWTRQGSRVLLAAEYQGFLQPGSLEEGKVTPLALILLSSPIREGAARTFRYFAEQGVSVRVLSGDDPRTASHVAAQAGIPGAEAYVDAGELDTDADFAGAAQEYTVFGRVTPDRKKRLIAALQAQGHTVAMTGDGVNDLLAMRQADCSVAMASGAQAASQLASLVLLDSDFAAMPGIVGEGRRVINNIQRSAALFLVKNIFSLLLSVISLFTVWPYPLQPMHLTLIAALTIGIPSFFLALEPTRQRIRGRFLPNVLRRAFPGGLTNVLVVLVCQLFAEVFGLSSGEVATVCAGVLAVVGMMVLYQVCTPFGRLRGILWWSMLAGLVLAFTLLGPVLELQAGDTQTRLAMAVLLLMTPTVFYAFRWLFDRGEEVYLRLKSR